MTILTENKKHKIFEEIKTMQGLILQVEDNKLFIHMQNSLANISRELYSISELNKIAKELKEQE